ncbi:hypothetical protein MP638_005200 [Amoeboaphelidium occidentale]|nr:hypothetical protein MP638_005200 [Amoeboaphelidium occidentale]
MSSSRGQGAAIEKDKNIFLKSVDNSEMYQYVTREAAKGMIAGTLLTGGSVLALNRFSPWFRNYTNVSARAFLVFSGAAVGFSLTSDWAMVHYYRFMDRPELSGFGKLSEAEKEKIHALSKGEIMKEFAWANRFKLLFTAWAGTLGTILYRNFSDPHKNSVAKFGEARISAQVITLASLIAAFAFNTESGPWAAKYQPGHDRSKDE